MSSIKVNDLQSNSLTLVELTNFEMNSVIGGNWISKTWKKAWNWLKNNGEIFIGVAIVIPFSLSQPDYTPNDYGFDSPTGGGN